MARKATTKEDVLTLARQRVSETFDRFDLPCVSFSAGKDSTVVLNLALEEARIRKADGRLPPDWRLRVIFWDEEVIHPQTIDYARRVAQSDEVDFRWLCLPIRHVNACSKTSPFWNCWAPEDKDKWVRPLPPEAITELPGFERLPHYACMSVVFPKSDGVTVGLMMGIRADESMRRFRSVTSRVKDNWLTKVGSNTDWIWFPEDGSGSFNVDTKRAAMKILGKRHAGAKASVIAAHTYRVMSGETVLGVLEDVGHTRRQAHHVYQCKVIYDWTTMDVWTAPRAFGWDWNRAYDVMAHAGLTPNQQRVAPPFGQQPMQNLWMWQVCWPELWERMVGRVPGAATAARYGLTPLYGSSGGATKRDDETWEDAITRELLKWEPGMQRKIAKRLKREMARHANLHPGVDIPGEEPYVMDLETGVTSGITWGWLLKVAIKGDVKGRMNPHRPSREDVDARRESEWGPHWRLEHREAAAKSKWDTKKCMWVNPDE